MFDHYQMGHRVQDRLVPHAKTVTELRAPTDESIRLVEELRATCRNELVRTLPCGDNLVQAQVALFREVMSFGIRVQMHCTFNGRDFTTSWTMEESASDTDVWERVYLEVAQRLAKQMVSDLARTNHGRVHF